MQITDVKATLHRIPVDMPLLKEKIWTPIVFVTVETDQGVTGYGLTRAAQRFGAREFINREAAPFLRGKNPVETERIWHQLYTTFNPRAQTGMWSSAVSAIDIALWDIKGKYYKEPVWRLLGGAQNPPPTTQLLPLSGGATTMGPGPTASASVTATCRTISSR